MSIISKSLPTKLPKYRKIVFGFLFVFAIPFTNHTAQAAGNCDGSAGPVTFITTARYTITSPGIYCLGQNIVYTPPATNSATSVIGVFASNVILDLNQRQLRGIYAGAVPGPSNAASGVLIGASVTNVTVRNGLITGFLSGIDIATNVGGNSVSGLVIENLTINQVARHAIAVGVNSTCSVCKVRNNTIQNVNGKLCTNCGGGSSYGIFMDRSSNVEILNNSVVDMSSQDPTLLATAIYVKNGSQALIDNNFITDIKNPGVNTAITGVSYSSVMASNNRIVGLHRGIDFRYAQGFYTGNIIVNTDIPYAGGVAQ